jgi:hypothetical protein
MLTAMEGTRRRALGMLLVTLLAWGCGPAVAVGPGDDRRGQVNGRLFEFSTAGSEHTDAHGAWLVRVRGNAMWIAQVLDGKTSEYGPFPLADKDEQKLWTMVDELDLLARSSKKVRSKRTAVYQLTMMKPKVTAHTVVLPMVEAMQDEAVVSMVAFMGSLIRRYAKASPVLTPDDE